MTVAVILRAGFAAANRLVQETDPVKLEQNHREFRKHPFFDETSLIESLRDPLTPDKPTGAVLAGINDFVNQNLNRLLAESFPAQTLPVGANETIKLGVSRNHNMQTEYETGWPSKDVKWLHSDFRDVAYPYVHKLYEAFVAIGGLK